MSIHGTTGIVQRRPSASVQQGLNPFTIRQIDNTTRVTKYRQNMIIPIRCFTCGKVIANKWETYLSLLQADFSEGYVDIIFYFLSYGYCIYIFLMIRM